MRAVFFSIAVSLSIMILLFPSCKRKCYFCNDKEAKYDTIYLNTPDSCGYIILRKRNADNANKKISWTGQNSLLEKFRPIDTTKAREYIQRYNVIHNSDLKNTSFIDFSTDELFAYLIEVTNWAKQNSEKFDNLRIYFGVNDESMNTVVLTATTSRGGDFIKNENFMPVDYGNLCPPPNDCINQRKAELLRRAISMSEDRIKP